MGFEPTPTEFRSDALTDWPITPRVQLAFTVNFVHLLQFNHLFNMIFQFGYSSVSKFILIKVSVGNQMSAAEWADIYRNQNLQNLWSSYRKLLWERFEPTITEFRSDALTDWTITSWAQLAFRAIFIQLLQFHRLSSVTFQIGCLTLSVGTFTLIEVF